MIDCFEKRFNNILEDHLFASMLVLLDTEFFPNEDADPVYGDQALSFAVSRFSEILLSNGCDINSVQREWQTLKRLVTTTGLHATNYISVWHKLCTSSKKEELKNILHVIELLMVMPVCNAVLERMFSTMNRVHTDWRNRLNERSVENLLRIREEGPSVGDFNPDKAMGIWSKRCDRRPDTQPNRPKPSTSTSGNDFKRKLPPSEVTDTVKRQLVDSQ